VRAPALALCLVAAVALACSDAGSSKTSTTTPSAAPSASATPTAAPAAQPSARKPTRSEKPLPAFEGVTLAGERLAVGDLLGRRLVLFLFNPEMREAAVAAKALRAIAGERAAHNFQIVGVGLGGERPKLERFVQEHGIDYPVMDDASGTIASRLQLRVPVAVLGVDAEGYVVFAQAGFPAEGATAVTAVETQLREALRLAKPGEDAGGLAVERPRAPEFTATPLDGGEPFRSATLRGKPILLVFFLHTCPHCHHLLEFLKGHLPTLPEAQRPVLVGISVSDKSDAVRATLQQDGLDFFPVLLDPDLAVRNAYGVFAGVPDTFVIDKEGRIVSRTQGWRDDRDPPLMKMRIAKISGLPVPMLLHQTGFSGNEFCGVCHEKEVDSWRLTNHAGAFETLVKHGADKDPECVSCHVVGHGKSGGYTASPPTPWLEDVGCESCHGRGGPHLTPALAKAASYESQCATCHDAKHSLGFSYAEFLPRVSHAALQQLASLPPEKKREILLARAKPRDDLLPQTAAYVGSAACQSCHAAEHATWSKSAHASALASLRKEGKAENADCLKCHTTGFGRTGGFPAGGKPDAHPGLAQVGCESCHGPGGEHVKEGAPRTGNIVSLGDKCDSCVILQICGSCHDEKNDPGFEFAVEKKIAAQKHGTIEPSVTRGQGKAQGADASRIAPRSGAGIAALERAFAPADVDPPRS
jgi:peroxiredoxin